MADDGPPHSMVPFVINAVSLAALRIPTAAIDTVRGSGDAMYRRCTTASFNNLIGLLHNYCQEDPAVMIDGTKVRYNDMLVNRLVSTSLHLTLTIFCFQTDRTQNALGSKSVSSCTQDEFVTDLHSLSVANDLLRSEG